MNTQKHRSNNIVLVQAGVLLTGLLILAAKFMAYYVTHSNAILTDALESIINIAAGTFALFSIYLSSKPRDADHPYGHGKVEFISAGFEGGLITLAGFSMIGKAVYSFFNPEQLHNLDIGLMIVVATGVINYAMGFYLIKTGEAHHSLTLKADGEHLKSDAYSSFGLLIGIALIILTKWYVLDNIVAIIFGCFIIYTGIKLVRKSMAGLMDETDESLVVPLIEQLNQHRQKDWIDIHNLRMIQFGYMLHIDCHITLPWYYDLRDAHRVIDEIHKIADNYQTAPMEFFIHTDPCIPQSCAICTLDTCDKRLHDFVKRVEWNIDNAYLNHKHGV